MWTIFNKEINGFLSSLIAYISMGVFLLATGLFLWVFPEYSLLEYGYAGLDSFFAIAPWIFMFLVPAITMRSFAEEKRSGTIEWLFTQPLADWQIILGKFLAGLALLIVCLIPTVLYYYTIYQLAEPVGNLDHGGILGSYVGLLFLGGGFVGIGLFSSSMTDNQIVSFVLAIFLNFFFYLAFSALSKMGFSNQFTFFLDQLSMDTHYLSLSKGVLDTRNMIYFLSLIAFFLWSCNFVLARRKW